MLLDANILLYAVDSSSTLNERAGQWLEEALNGDRRVGLPWQSIGAFLRIVTHPRVTTDPLTPEDAWSFVQGWLDADPTWVPPATERTAAVLRRLVETTPASANLIPDAQLAALAIEHGLTVVTADTDFARFPDVRWHNPFTG